MLKTKIKPKCCPHCGTKFNWVDYYEMTRQWGGYCTSCEQMKYFDKILVDGEQR